MVQDTPPVGWWHCLLVLCCWQYMGVDVIYEVVVAVLPPTPGSFFECLSS